MRQTVDRDNVTTHPKREIQVLQQTLGRTALVGPADSGYRTWCRLRRERRESGRPRDPFAQDYNAELMRWEVVVQKLLAAAIPNSVDERILVSTQYDRKGKVASIYHELDFVSGPFSAPQMFVEIKIREQSINAKTGWSQLDRSLRIARSQWPNLRGICVNIAIGDLLGTEQECAITPIAIPDMRDAVADLSQQDGATIWLRGSDVAAFAMEHSLLTCEDVLRLPDLRQAMLNPTIVLQMRDAPPESNQPGLFDRFRPRQ
jgi:hypothetical protein